MDEAWWRKIKDGRELRRLETFREIFGCEAALADEIRSQLKTAATPVVDRKAIERQLAGIDQKLRQAAERLVSVPASLVATVEAKMLELQGQRSGLLTTLEHKPAVPKVNAKAVAAKLWTIASKLEQFSPATIREWLSALIDHVQVEFRQRPTKAGRMIYRAVSAQIHLHNAAAPPGRCGAIVQVTAADFRRFGLTG